MMQKKFRKILISVIFILVFLRFWNLESMPIFGDEALYLWFADEIDKNLTNLFIPIPYHVFPVVPWVLALFQKFNLHSNPLVEGRIISVGFDLISGWLVFLIGKNLINRYYGFVASLIYLSLPINFLHSRLVLLDSITNTFVLTIIYLVLKASYSNILFRIHWKWIALIISLLVISFYAKPVAAISFGAVLLIPFIAIIEKKYHIKKIILVLLNFSISFILGFVIILGLYSYLGQGFNQHYLADNNSSIYGSISHFKINLWKTAWWANAYITTPILIIVFITSWIALFQKNIKLCWLFVWMTSIIFINSILYANYYPRHLYPIAAPISLICAYLLYLEKTRILSLTLLVLLLIYPSKFVFGLITNPISASLALEDKQQFFEDASSGVGNQEVADYLKSVSRNQEIAVIAENEANFFWALPNLYNIGKAKVYTSLNLSSGRFVEDSLLRNLQNYEIYIITNRNAASGEWPIRMVRSIPKGPNRNLNIYQFISPLK